MGQSVESAMLLTLLSGLAAFATLAGLLRYFRAAAFLGALLTPAAFLAAYWATYGKVPDFPPVGAVNKIFYIAAFGTVLGLIADRFAKPVLAYVLVLAQPVVVTAYIGGGQVAAAPAAVIGTALVGMAVMALLYRAGRSSGEAALQAGTALAVASLGFAPLALLGASSASMQLALMFAACLGGILIWRIIDDGFRLTAADLLGGAGGLIAVVCTVALITRKIDLAALAILALVFAVPALFALIPGRALPQHRLIRVFVFGLLCLVPAIAAIAFALARYDQPLPF